MSAAAIPQIQGQAPPPPPGYTQDVTPTAQAAPIPAPPPGYTQDVTPPSTQGDTSGFDTSSLGPNFKPDYSVDVYAKPLPPDAEPGFWGALWNHIKDSAMGSAMAPFDVAIPGVYRGAAGASHLFGNAMDALDHIEKLSENITGQKGTDWYKRAADWFHSQAAGAQQTAQNFSLGRKQDFGTQLGQAMVSGATQIPQLALATAAAAPMAAVTGLGELGASMAGFGGLSALGQEDKGVGPALTAGAEGAISGGAYHFLSPLGLPLRVPLNALFGYLSSDGDATAKLSSGAAQGLFSMLPGAGGAGVRDVAGNFADMVRPVDAAKSAAGQNVIRLGQKYNVPLTAGDITQSPALKNMEVSLEKVPGVGMQKLREGQQENVRAAAAGIKSLYEEKLLDTDQSSLEELQTAAAAGDERARNVMEKMQNAGNDPDRIIQASIGLGDWTTRQTAKELYDHVQQLAEEHNLGDVPLDATGKAIGSALQQLRPAKLPNKEVIGLLSRIRDSITPELDEEGEPVVDEQGNPVKPDNSYGLIRQLHSDLGERIREYYQGNNALIGEKGVGYLERVQNALEDDMRNYAQNSNVPEIVDAGREADGYYKRARVPYKNGMLAAAATSNEPDQIFQQFIKAGKGDRAQNFYNALDDKGRAAVRYNMVSKAVDDSVNPQSGIFSPQKFFTAVDKLDDAYGVFFNAKDKAEIQGFKNLMGHVIRAGQYAENPPTGQRVIPILMGIAGATAAPSVLAHPLIAGGGAAVLGMTRALFTTARGRNLLLRLNGIKPGTPVADSVWQQVGREMPKLMAPPKTPPQ